MIHTKLLEIQSTVKTIMQLIGTISMLNYNTGKMLGRDPRAESALCPRNTSPHLCTILPHPSSRNCLYLTSMYPLKPKLLDTFCVHIKTLLNISPIHGQVECGTTISQNIYSPKSKLSLHSN